VLPQYQALGQVVEDRQPWYALRVRPRHEKAVAASLLGRGYKYFLPLYRARRRWSDRYREVDLPLFPGYLFCAFPMHARIPIITISGVLHVVGIGNTPVPVDEAEMVALQSVAESGLLSQPWPFLRVGQTVRLEEGPLRNVEGILTEIQGAHHVVVSVTLLQRSVAVRVEREWAHPS